MASYEFLPRELAERHFEPDYYHHTDPELRSDWLAFRGRFKVSASNCGALWNLMPGYRWNYGKMVLRAADRLTGELARETNEVSAYAQRIMDFGRKFEPVAIRDLAQELQLPIYRTGIFYDDAHNVGATPDGVLFDHPGRAGLMPFYCQSWSQGCVSPILLEVKSRSQGHPLYEDLPVYYYLQMQWQMWLSRVCTECIYLHGRFDDARGLNEYQVRLVRWRPEYAGMFERRLAEMDEDIRQQWADPNVERPVIRGCPEEWRQTPPAERDVQRFRRDAQFLCPVLYRFTRRANESQYCL